MSIVNGTAPTLDLTDSIRDIFVQVTRYPKEILDPASSLEEDLGIDSVKLGEVFAVLREQYKLSDTLQIPREQLRSIETISQSLQAHLAQLPPTAVVTNVAPAAPVAAPAAVAASAASLGDLQSQIRDVFAAVTRYPADILEPTASLEEDLGIDSVKLGEVFAVLREKYALPMELDIPREQFKTIEGITAGLSKYLAASAPAPAPSPAATRVATVPASPAVENVEEAVRAIFAEVTRYPAEILDPAASLEEDLGIDSVKLGEVFSVMRDRYTLPEDLGLSREHYKTIGTISAALRTFLKAPAQPAARVESPAPVVNAALNGHATAQTNGHVRPATPVQSFADLNPNRRPFEGKVALITGSGRALGKDIAVYLADLGATVIINSFHSREQGEKTAAEINASGGKAVHIWGSVANPQQLHAMFDEIEAKFGGLDFFVSNASNGMLAKLEDLTPEHFEKAFRTNVIGLHQSALRAVQLMRKRGGGKIVTLSSPASHGYVDYFGCMATVKAAVESLTKTMAIEFAKDNIHVNCVSPGPIYGELLNKWPESKRLIAEWEQATVTDRLCENRDVSQFVAYLLSDVAALFTGSVLVMDGGISVRWGGVSGKPDAGKLSTSPVKAAAMAAYGD